MRQRGADTRAGSVFLRCCRSRSQRTPTIPFVTSLRTPEVVEIEVSPAAAICVLRVAGNLACRRPFRPPGALESPPVARIGCHTTALRPNSVSPAAKFAGATSGVRSLGRARDSHPSALSASSALSGFDFVFSSASRRLRGEYSSHRSPITDPNHASVVSNSSTREDGLSQSGNRTIAAFTLRNCNAA